VHRGFVSITGENNQVPSDFRGLCSHQIRGSV